MKKKNELIKSAKFREVTWERLNNLKIKYKYRNVDAVVTALLDDKKFK